MTSEHRREQLREAQRRRRAGGELLRPPVAACGTEAGARRHRRDGETVCDLCRQAEADARRRRRTSA
ncbi:MAG: hypothetical protein ACKV2O_11125 [Acidimicrobiales bacterium]